MERTKTIRKQQGVLKMISALLFMLIVINTSAQFNTVAALQDNDSSKVLTDFKNRKAIYVHNQAAKLFQGGDYSGAIALWDEVISLSEMAPFAHYNRGLCNLRLDNPVEAMLDFSEAVRGDPRPEFYFGRGILYYQRNDSTAALADFQKALQSEQYRPYSHIYIGWLHLRQKNYSIAAQSFGEAYNSQPENLLALNGRAWSYLVAGDTLGAIEAFVFSLDTDPEQFQVLRLLADIHFKRRNFSDALEIYKTASNFVPDDPALLNLRALISHLQIEPDSAQYFCNLALDADPRHSVSWNTHGILAYAKNDFSMAEADFSMALSLSPSLYKAYYNRALSRELLRNDAGACDDWRTASDNGVKEASKYFKEICE